MTDGGRCRVKMIAFIFVAIIINRIFAEKKNDEYSNAPKEKVQAILRMSPETYEAIRRAAGRSHKSFNSYAVETLEAAAMPQPEPKIKISELKPDPEWERFIVHSLDLTEEEIRNDPRLSAILGL